MLPSKRFASCAAVAPVDSRCEGRPRRQRAGVGRHSGGTVLRIVAHWLDRGGVEVVICPALLEEVEHVLSRPRLRKRVEPGVAQLYMATVRRIADLVADPEPVAAETRDPDDEYLVALAREHGVDWIVTGDKDLLEWEDQLPPAITPAAFEELLDGPGN